MTENSKLKGMRLNGVQPAYYLAQNKPLALVLTLRYRRVTKPGTVTCGIS